MRKADDELVRCLFPRSSRVKLIAICKVTGERRWEAFRRLLDAEHRRLFPLLEDSLAEEEDA